MKLQVVWRVQGSSTDDLAIDIASIILGACCSVAATYIRRSLIKGMARDIVGITVITMIRVPAIMKVRMEKMQVIFSE